MVKCAGKSVLKGIAVGKIYVCRKQEYALKQTQIDDVKTEQERFELAVSEAKGQLDILYKNALKTVGEEEAMIFDVHKMMLEDEGYLEDIKEMIAGKGNAEYAVNEVGNNYSRMFAAMDDDYMKARSADVLDISRRIINNLAGTRDASVKTKEPVILLADEPTGNLDPQTAWDIMMLLQEVNRAGTTVVVVTHNNDIVDVMQKRVITLDQGLLVHDEKKGGYLYEGI